MYTFCHTDYNSFVFYTVLHWAQEEWSQYTDTGYVHLRHTSWDKEKVKNTVLSDSSRQESNSDICNRIFHSILFTQLPELIFSVTRRTDLYSLIPIFVHFIAIDIYLISPALDPVVIMRNRDFRNAMARMLGHRSEASHGIAPLPVQHYNLPPLPST